MIALAADTHKRSHSIRRVSDVRRSTRRDTVQSGAKGAAGLLRWARGVGGEGVWAIEDCRHVSGSLERLGIARGERVLRVHNTR
jgi:transposase